jgi:hypothetical protein
MSRDSCERCPELRDSQGRDQEKPSRRVEHSTGRADNTASRALRGTTGGRASSVPPRSLLVVSATTAGEVVDAPPHCSDCSRPGRQRAIRAPRSGERVASTDCLASTVAAPMTSNRARPGASAADAVLAGVARPRAALRGCPRCCLRRALWDARSARVALSDRMRAIAAPTCVGQRVIKRS